MACESISSNTNGMEANSEIVMTFCSVSEITMAWMQLTQTSMSCEIHIIWLYLEINSFGLSFCTNDMQNAHRSYFAKKMGSTHVLHFSAQSKMSDIRSGPRPPGPARPHEQYLWVP
ncbi:hypothetical protein GUJ93_ZPchr0005g15660 [Zizania palustris]|uniref:Uncharacterized protein n=1 Tax=Zizania palustris TaxID=103762 RepID=A0A8J5SXD2_ZIZPA|nr:hypothetical protein GUJ93_ZPchr0005g15660 [Zizania palustris]